MQVMVRIVNGGTETFSSLKPDHTISVIKAMVQVKAGTPMHDLRLLFNGKELEDGRTLSECNIYDGATVQALLRLRGGGKRKVEIQSVFTSSELALFSRLPNLLQSVVRLKTTDISIASWCDSLRSSKLNSLNIVLSNKTNTSAKVEELLKLTPQFSQLLTMYAMTTQALSHFKNIFVESISADGAIQWSDIKHEVKLCIRFKEKLIEQASLAASVPVLNADVDTDL